MSLETQVINARIYGRFVSEPLRKEGARSTLYANFHEIKPPFLARLQHSPSGLPKSGWADIDESAVEIGEGIADHTQAWSENVMPEGTMLRMVVECNSAYLENIKLLSA